MRFESVQVALAMLALVLVGGSARGAVSQSQQGSTMTEIQSLIRSKQYDRAVVLTSANLEKTPMDYHLWTVQGIALSLKGDTSRALDSFDQAIHLAPTYTPALKAEVQVLFQSGDKRAIPLLETILKADPRDLTAHEMLANLERRSGDCVSANEHFQLAGEAIGNHRESLEAYGYCLFETKQPEKAIPVFEQLAAILPDRTYPKYDLAVVQVAGKQYEAAIKTLEPLLTDDQKDPDLLSLASQAYEATKNTPRAVALLRQAIVLEPEDAWLLCGFRSSVSRARLVPGGRRHDDCRSGVHFPTILRCTFHVDSSTSSLPNSITPKPISVEWRSCPRSRAWVRMRSI